MSRSDPPSGDAALLVGLTAVVSAMIGFGALMYWLAQPTVLPNAAFEVLAEKRAPIILRAAPQTHPPDVEQAAIAMAARENEIQGLRPIALATAEPAAASPVQTAAHPVAKAAKPKRVAARAPRRDAGAAFASNWWGGGQSFGGFGGWYR